MVNYLRCGVLIGAMLLLSATDSEAAAKSPYERAYSHQALLGDLSGIETLSITPSGEADSKLKSDFHARFVTREYDLDLSGVQDELILQTAVSFQEYWKTALMDPSVRTSAERNMYGQLKSVLQTHEIEISSGPETAMIEAFAARGYQLLLGRTDPLLEFMAWRSNEVINYQVQLTDTVQPVKVTFMDDFISRGWLDFATFGMEGTGGWTKKEGLFAVNSYDRNSEKFTVSYLKHEARHFADGSIFPALQGADLEYRAKLTELAFASSELEHLLMMFSHQAQSTSSAPHPLANWHVIKNLSARILGKKAPIDVRILTEAGAAKINSAARELLIEHTNLLNSLGSETVESVIAPETDHVQ